MTRCLHPQGILCNIGCAFQAKMKISQLLPRWSHWPCRAFVVDLTIVIGFPFIKARMVLLFSHTWQPLQNLLITKLSMTLLFSWAIATTTPFNDAYPRRCHVPSIETPQSTISFSVKSSFKISLTSEQLHFGFYKQFLICPRKQINNTDVAFDCTCGGIFITATNVSMDSAPALEYSES